jgi:glycosyltransferase involved in cell wall biosynthesis
MSDRDLRVVFVVTGLPVGGAEIALYRLLSSLPPRVKPHVISLRETNQIGCLIEKLGVQVEYLDMNPGRFNPFAVARLVQKLKALRPDVVQSWMYHADLLGGISAKLADPSTPVVWNVRHNSVSPHDTKMATIAVAKLCAWLSPSIPASIIFNSESSRTRHVEFGYARERTVVIPNGIDFKQSAADPKARTKVRQELGIPLDEPLVGMIARLDPAKNHAGFIRIAARLGERMPNCHFLLAGHGVERGRAPFDEWVSSTHLGERLHLLGQRNDIPSLMTAIDVLAMPSHSEAFPNVVAEALACGTPCVVTDVGDASHILGNAGRVVPPRDDEAFLLSLEDVLRMEAGERRSFGERGRLRAQELFSLERMSNSYVALYESILDRRLNGTSHLEKS